MGNVPTLKDATKGALTDIGDLCNALCLESYAPFCYTYIRVAYVRGMSPKIYSERLIYIVPSITKWAWVFRSIWFSNILRASTCGGSEKSRKGAQTRWWVSRGEAKIYLPLLVRYQNQRCRVLWAIAISIRIIVICIIIAVDEIQLGYVVNKHATMKSDVSFFKNAHVQSIMTLFWRHTQLKNDKCSVDN